MPNEKYTLHTNNDQDNSSPDLPKGEKGVVTLVYIFLIMGLFFPVFSIVAVVLAYINRADAPEWLRSHYRFQIRTFWIGLLIFFVGALLLLILIGKLILVFWFVWVLVRVIKGLTYLSRHQAHPDPATLMFG